ncbi:MAG: DUF3159 domain-containing protein [Marmoricola sp.]
MLQGRRSHDQFTIAFLTTHRLWLAVGLSVAAATVLLIVRLVQRTSVQFVMNAFVGIAIGAFFAYSGPHGLEEMPPARPWRTSCPAS